MWVPCVREALSTVQTLAFHGKGWWLLAHVLGTGRACRALRRSPYSFWVTVLMVLAVAQPEPSWVTSSHVNLHM